jgi:hypothetical protein
MKVNRRKTLGILAAAAAGASATIAQAPPPRPADADSELRTAREGFQNDAQRIAAVKLPQATEPAFQFRA